MNFTTKKPAFDMAPNFKFIYEHVWSKRLSKIKNTYLVSMKLCARKINVFFEFIEDNKMHLDVISINRGFDNGKGVFNVIANTDIVSYNRLSKEGLGLEMLRKTFVLLHSTIPDNISYKLNGVLSLSDISKIKVAINDNRRVLDFKFMYRIEKKILVFEHQKKIKYLNLETGSLETKPDFYELSEQLSFFDVSPVRELEYIAYCKLNEKIFFKYLIK